MTFDEIRVTRIEASTRACWPGRVYALPPQRWAEALSAHAGTPVEFRTRPAALSGMEPAVLLAAARLRDAGVGLSLAGAGAVDGFRWLRALPWSAVIVHPALCADDPDRRRLLDRWVEAVHRRGMALVAPRGTARDLPRLHRAGFTHLEMAAL